MLRVLPSTNQTCRATNLPFVTKSVHTARFTGSSQTCFAASEVNPVSGVTPARFYPRRSQYSLNLTWFVAIQAWTCVVKRAISLSNSFCNNVAKQVARFSAVFSVVAASEKNLCDLEATVIFAKTLCKVVTDYTNLFKNCPESLNILRHS